MGKRKGKITGKVATYTPESEDAALASLANDPGPTAGPSNEPETGMAIMEELAVSMAQLPGAYHPSSHYDHRQQPETPITPGPPPDVPASTPNVTALGLNTQGTMSTEEVANSLDAAARATSTPPRNIVDQSTYVQPSLSRMSTPTTNGQAPPQMTFLQEMRELMREEAERTRIAEAQARQAERIRANKETQETIQKSIQGINEGMISNWERIEKAVTEQADVFTERLSSMEEKWNLISTTVAETKNIAIDNNTELTEQIHRLRKERDAWAKQSMDAMNEVQVRLKAIDERVTRHKEQNRIDIDRMETELKASQIKVGRDEEVVQLDIESIRTPIRPNGSRVPINRPTLIPEEPETGDEDEPIEPVQVKEEGPKSNASSILRGGTSEERLQAAGLLQVRGRDTTIGRSQSEGAPPGNQQTLEQRAPTTRSTSRTSEEPSQPRSPPARRSQPAANGRGMTPYLRMMEPEAVIKELRDVDRSISPMREGTPIVLRDNLARLILKADEERLRLTAVPESASAFAKLSIKPAQPEAYTGKSSRLEDLEMFVSRTTMWFRVTGMLCIPMTTQMVSLISMWLKEDAHEWYNQMYVLGDAQMEEVTPRMLFEGLRERFTSPLDEKEAADEFDACRQGTTKLLKYANRLQNLAARMKELPTPYAFRRRFWKGMRDDIRFEIRRFGFNPEQHSFDQIREAALKMEATLDDKAEETTSNTGRYGKLKVAKTTATTPQPAQKVTQNLGRSTIPAKSNRLEDIVCHRCGKKGHVQRLCKEAPTKAYLVQTGETIAEATERMNDPDAQEPYPITIIEDEEAEEGYDALVEAEDEAEELMSGTVQVEPESEVNVGTAKAGNIQWIFDISTRKDDKSSPSRMDNECIQAWLDFDGKVAHTIFDSGCNTNIMSTTFVKAMGIEAFELTDPVKLKLALQGSRGSIKHGLWLDFKTEKGTRKVYFDIAPIETYDVILGTPFLHAHDVIMGFGEQSRVTFNGTEEFNTLVPLEKTAGKYKKQRAIEKAESKGA